MSGRGRGADGAAGPSADPRRGRTRRRTAPGEWGVCLEAQGPTGGGGGRPATRATALHKYAPSPRAPGPAGPQCDAPSLPAATELPRHSPGAVAVGLAPRTVRDRLCAAPRAESGRGPRWGSHPPVLWRRPVPDPPRRAEGQRCARFARRLGHRGDGPQHGAFPDFQSRWREEGEGGGGDRAPPSPGQTLKPPPKSMVVSTLRTSLSRDRLFAEHCQRNPSTPGIAGMHSAKSTAGVGVGGTPRG